MKAREPQNGVERGLVLGCFALSGAVGLAYQAIWFRELQSLFGVTAHALAVVVAAFMGGLAAGSVVFGRLADRHPAPLRLYGWLELGIGVAALAVTPLLWLVERAYVGLYPALSDSGAALAIVRAVLAWVAILLPTLFMGGTLPALVVHWRRRQQHATDDTTVRGDLGLLYGLNTAGAVAGTALVGFVLLEHLGLRATTCVAAALNIAIGLVCVRFGGTRRTLVPSAAPAPATPVRATSLAAFIAIAFAVSGGLALAAEIAWTRVLAQIIGSSTYAFSLILCAFLSGIALGSLALERVRTRPAIAAWGFGAAQAVIAAGSALVLPVLVHLPDLELRGFAQLQGGGGVLWLQFGIASLVVLVPTLAMGAAFPLAAGVVTRGRADVGNAIGRLYAGNTVGGIAGALLAGFVLLPVVGSQRTIVGLIVAHAVIAIATCLFVRRASPIGAVRTATVLGVALLAGAVAIATPTWDRYALDAGVAIGGPAITAGDPSVRTRDLARGSEILFYREGLNANISVRKDETQLYLKTNGKTDGTSRGDMPTQLMLGLLPALVHPQPSTALVIGLGTGASAHAASLPTTLRRLDVVEIEPAVVEAARGWFAAVHGNLFSDPRVHIVVDDARAFLLTSRERYSFIVSEPSNPWIAGVASLFAVDHYERVAARLADGGILAQWLQIYAMEPELVRMVLASMQQVFPHVQVWSFHHGDLIVLASRTPFPPFDPPAIDRRLKEWRADHTMQRTLDVETAAGLLGSFVLAEEDARAFAAGAAVTSDDRPRLEFAAPRSLYRSTRESNAALLAGARRTELPPVVPGWTPSSQEALDVAGAMRRSRRPEDAARWLARSGIESAEWHLEAGRQALAQGVPDRALQSFTAAVQATPPSIAAAQELARLRFMQGRSADAVALLPLACSPAALDTWDTGELALQLLEATIERGESQSAVAIADQLLAAADGIGLDPVLHARLWAQAARIAAAQGDPETAHDAATRALELNPQCTAAWQVLGALAFEAERYSEAIGWWQRAVDFRQTGPDLLVPLAIAYQRSDRIADARRIARRALREAPEHRGAQRLAQELGV